MHLLLGRVEWKSTNWWPASWTAPLALGGSLATAELLLSGAGIPSLLVVPRGPRPSCTERGCKACAPSWGARAALTQRGVRVGDKDAVLLHAACTDAWGAVTLKALVLQLCPCRRPSELQLPASRTQSLCFG